MAETEYEKDDQDLRIEAILGDEEADVCDENTEMYYDHLKNNLTLPCEVAGIEDFRWEEFYIVGFGDAREHKKLRENQPSCKDKYNLLDIEMGISSEWMCYAEEDLAARVKRKSDGKEFYLGLSEIESLNKKSHNYQLLEALVLSRDTK